METLPTLSKIPLDDETIDGERLDIANKFRSNLLPWRGQFSPQLVEVLLEHYGSDAGFVFDPFAGSGTVLYECGRLGLRAAGCEVNPAAFILSRVYELINVRAHKRLAAMRHIDELVQKVLPAQTPTLWSGQEGDIALGAAGALHRLQNAGLGEIGRILVSALVILSFGKKSAPDEDDVYSARDTLYSVLAVLPTSEHPIQAVHADARRTPLPDQSIDFVITSPPYANVINYHEQYRAGAEFLGYDILDLAQSEIGANRKNRRNRFLTVIQYCIDMADVFRELRRVSHPKAQWILVLGRESTVNKTRFFNGDIVARVLRDSLGLEVAVRQERRFTNRFGKQILEDILHVHLGSHHRPVQTPIEVGTSILRQAESRAPREKLDLLYQAIEEGPSVRGSPIYH